MFLEKVVAGPLSTNAYLIGCGETKKGAIIDPGQGSVEKLLEKAQKHQITVEKILLTHSHWDHIVDVSLLKKSLGAQVYIHKLDQGNLEKPGSDGLPLFFSIIGAEPDVLLEGGEKIFVGTLELQVIGCPGHSPGGIAFYIEKEGILFSGDTLFQGGIGNLSLPTAEPEKMWTSLETLSKLPRETKVFPGHGSETTVGREFSKN